MFPLVSQCKPLAHEVVAVCSIFGFHLPEAKVSSFAIDSVKWEQPLRQDPWNLMDFAVVVDAQPHLLGAGQWALVPFLETAFWFCYFHEHEGFVIRSSYCFGSLAGAIVNTTSPWFCCSVYGSGIVFFWLLWAESVGFS